MNPKDNKTNIIKPLHIVLIACIAAVVCLGAALSASIHNIKANSSKAISSIEDASEATFDTEIAQEAVSETISQTASLAYPTESSSMLEIPEDLILSKYAILVDVSTNEIIAQRNADSQLYPASMSKIMTLIVAMEHISDYDTTFTMTSDIIDPLKSEGAALAGFSDGEVVTVRDLLYACALPSGAEATTALAILVSGSEIDFATLMNQKAAELGLANTHFSNCTGLHDENHYTTATDMAMIMQYAMQNEELKEILSTYQYTTSSTDYHPDGILLESTTFSKIYGDEVDGFTIVAGKTGYTDEAGYCLVSYAESDNGDQYICVAANSEGSKGAVYDTLNLYGLISGGYYSPTTTEPSVEATTVAAAVQEEDNNNDDVEYETIIVYEEVTEAPANNVQEDVQTPEADNNDDQVDDDPQAAVDDQNVNVPENNKTNNIESAVESAA
jgi:D-alanyl-D-alanine carboxypeptidase (penicillin-binding protein 5/6)